MFFGRPNRVGLVPRGKPASARFFLKSLSPPLPTTANTGGMLPSRDTSSGPGLFLGAFKRDKLLG